MKGPIESIADSWSEEKGHPTMAQDLEQGDVRVATETEQIGKLVTAFGIGYTAISTWILSDPIEPVEMKVPDNIRIREAIETAINAGFNIPIFVAAIGAVSATIEGASIWYRGRKRRLELEQAS